MIEFEPDGHIYTVNGKILPSVTQILAPYSALEFVDKDLLQRAADFGSNVHAACHLFNIGELNRASLDPLLEPYVAGWERFLDESGAVVILSEYRIASVKHGFAGTFDALLHWGKSKRLVDIKSGTVVPRTVGPQLAAYVEAYACATGERIRDRYCIHLPGEGQYNSHKFDDPRDWTYFKSALNLHHWFYEKRRAA